MQSAALRNKCSMGLIALCFGASTHAGGPLADATELAQMSLDDLLRVEVRGASRYAQPLADSPASVTVIEQHELQRHGYRNLAEALSSVPGAYVSNDRNYSYLGVRGFNRPGDYNSRILLLTDGARRNDALYDQAQIGNESPIELDWVKRLEFVSGPASAVYGANALFGIVNAVMLDGGDINGARLTADVGSGVSRRLGLLAGQRIDSEHEWFLRWRPPVRVAMISTFPSSTTRRTTAGPVAWMERPTKKPMASCALATGA